MKKLKYKYVVGIEHKKLKNEKENHSWVFGVSDLDALMQVVFRILEDKTIKSWTTLEYAQARKSGLTKFVDSVCTGLEKSKKKRKK